MKVDKDIDPSEQTTRYFLSNNERTIIMNKENFFLMVDRKYSAYYDHLNPSKPTLEEFIPLLLWIYINCLGWQGTDYGTYRGTLKEMALGLGYGGENSAQFQRLRKALQAIQKEGLITDQTYGTPIESGKIRPTDFLMIQFNKVAFAGSKNFVMAKDRTIKKFFEAKTVMMERNTVVKLINFWFAMSCTVYGNKGKPCSHKRLRKTLGKSDTTLHACYHILHEMGLFSRKQIFNADNNRQWIYYAEWAMPEESE